MCDIAAPRLRSISRYSWQPRLPGSACGVLPPAAGRTFQQPIHKAIGRGLPFAIQEGEKFAPNRVERTMSEDTAPFERPTYAEPQDEARRVAVGFVIGLIFSIVLWSMVAVAVWLA